jgi:uncharacterized membrane protein YfhO
MLHTPDHVPSNEVSTLVYEPNRTSWRVDTDEDGYLFVSDAYDAGWHAYLDGVPIPLYRANIAFRAVFIPEGAHTVEFQYRPVSFFAGLAAGIVTLSVVLVLLGWSFVHHRNRR